MKRDEEAAPVLSAGVLDGGSTDGGACADAARALGRRVQRKREGVESPLNVNVVFQPAGRHVTPDFPRVPAGRSFPARRPRRCTPVVAAEPLEDRLLHAQVGSAELRRHVAPSPSRSTRDHEAPRREGPGSPSRGHPQTCRAQVRCVLVFDVGDVGQDERSPRPQEPHGLVEHRAAIRHASDVAHALR